MMKEFSAKQKDLIELKRKHEEVKELQAISEAKTDIIHEMDIHNERSSLKLNNCNSEVLEIKRQNRILVQIHKWTTKYLFRGR